MRCTITFLTFIGFALIYSTDAGNEPKCLGKTMHFTDAQKETMKTCVTEWKGRHPNANATEHPWNETCFVACRFTKSGWVKDGKFVVETAKTDIVAMVSDIPTEDQDKLKTAFDDCASKQMDTLSTDEDCKSFMDIGKCIFKAVYTICKMEEQQQ